MFNFLASFFGSVFSFCRFFIFHVHFVWWGFFLLLALVIKIQLRKLWKRQKDEGAKVFLCLCARRKFIIFLSFHFAFSLDNNSFMCEKHFCAIFIISEVKLAWNCLRNIRCSCYITLWWISVDSIKLSWAKDEKFSSGKLLNDFIFIQKVWNQKVFIFIASTSLNCRL